LIRGFERGGGGDRRGGGGGYDRGYGNRGGGGERRSYSTAGGDGGYRGGGGVYVDDYRARKLFADTEGPFLRRDDESGRVSERHRLGRHRVLRVCV
jgi:hypothetical protein